MYSPKVPPRAPSKQRQVPPLLYRDLLGQILTSPRLMAGTATLPRPVAAGCPGLAHQMVASLRRWERTSERSRSPVSTPSLARRNHIKQPVRITQNSSQAACSGGRAGGRALQGRSRSLPVGTPRNKRVEMLGSKMAWVRGFFPCFLIFFPWVCKPRVSHLPALLNERSKAL